MSKIWINDNVPVEGSFSFSVTQDDTQDPPVFAIEGAFQTDEQYFTEISTISNERYRLERVNVYSESYGSEEDMIVYSFRAGAYRMKNFDGKGLKTIV